VIHFIDTSALIKLVRQEEHSDALGAWVKSTHPDLLISDLVITETMRVARRISPDAVQRTRDVLASCRVRTMSPDIWLWAAEMNPHSLRTLDALHLAVALSAGSDLGSVITYDRRLAEAAMTQGLHVMAPT